MVLTLTYLDQWVYALKAGDAGLMQAFGQSQGSIDPTSPMLRKTSDCSSTAMNSTSMNSHLGSSSQSIRVQHLEGSDHCFRRDALPRHEEEIDEEMYSMGSVYHPQDDQSFHTTRTGYRRSSNGAPPARGMGMTRREYDEMSRYTTMTGRERDYRRRNYNQPPPRPPPQHYYSEPRFQHSYDAPPPSRCQDRYMAPPRPSYH